MSGATGSGAAGSGATGSGSVGSASVGAGSAVAAVAVNGGGSPPVGIVLVSHSAAVATAVAELARGSPEAVTWRRSCRPAAPRTAGWGRVPN